MADIPTSGRALALPPLVDPAAELTEAEIARYSRHIIIPEMGIDGQRRLKNAKVLVIGAGGLGSPILLYLAAAGVGMIGIADFDVVDESNLQRQIIHGQFDIGKLKAASAQETLAEINPLVKVHLHTDRLTRENVLEIFARYDILIDGTDNFATRYLVNDAAVLAKKPYVWGSIFRFEGQASVFWEAAPHGRGLNYRDLYPEPPPPGMVPSCAEGGVFGVLCGSIGSIMATEALKMITGIGEPLLGRLISYDAITMRYREVKIRKDPSVPPVTELVDYEVLCGIGSLSPQLPKKHTITPAELKAKFDAGENFFLIDVREPVEYHIVHIAGATLIPKADILSGAALPALPRDKPLVLHCKAGIRSAEALAALHAAGFHNATHLAGGIDAWIQQIEPHLPTY